MPLTAKGEKIMASMKAEYGEKKGEQVFYASRNAGKITHVDPESAHPDNVAHHGHMVEHLQKAGHGSI